MNFIKEENFEKILDDFNEEIASVRTGRANPSLIEDVQVEAYGTNQPLQSLASVASEDAKTLLVEPYDENVTQAIETALHEADIGVNPVTDGNKIRLPLPDLTSERRKELINLLKEKAEQARIEIRNKRGEMKKKIEQAEENGELTEDQKYNKLDQLDEVVKDFNQQVEDKLEEKKEKIQQI